MSSESTVAQLTPQETVSAGINRAEQLQSLGKLEEAARALEESARAARATPYEVEFTTRIRLGMTLADLYLALNRLDEARAFLAEETAFAERISQIMNATGTLNQKRAAMSGYLQIRDRATQIGLLGKPAPEINPGMWLVGEATALADLRGRVILLEFWATWCKPCQEMFPKLTSLYDREARNGLEIVALTRHYLAFGGPVEAKNEELNLMRKMVSDHGVTFRVAVSDDERLQATYGANGLPTVVLIDRKGFVQYAGPGGEDPALEKRLHYCLSEND
jgi:thiol-disulfide isomerase/thioredoxin